MGNQILYKDMEKIETKFSGYFRNHTVYPQFLFIPLKSVKLPDCFDISNSVTFFI